MLLRGVKGLNTVDYLEKQNTVEIYDAAIEYEQDCKRNAVLKHLNKKCTSDEALIECVNAYGTVNLTYMSGISSLSIEELISDLRGTTIFQDPDVFHGMSKWSMEDGWLLAPRYLCGNIPEKYAVAVEMEERFPGCFGANIEALKRLMPSKLSLEEIHVSLGASWVPSWVYTSFICDLLRLTVPPAVYFNKELSTWKIESPDILRTSVANNYTYGTVDLPAIRIIEQTMNARTVKVYDYTYHSNGTFDHVLNQPKTLEAQEKQRAIIRAFEEWIFADDFRKAKLQEAYNDAYVGYTFSPYNGSFLRLPGLNPDIELYQHQRDAIARILLSQSNVLLAHDVGTGKTYEMVVSAHELKRMGLSEKNLIVVPNNVLKATVDAHKLLYPDDKILAVFPKDFAPKYREETLETIRDKDFVCVYMAYSSFDMIVMSKDYWVKKKQQNIRDLRSAAANCSRKDEKRVLELEADQQNKKLSKFVLEAQDTPWLPFEKLGITTLFVDEAHNYKNIPLTSRTDNIVGMHNNGSKKCREMFEKCHNVERVIFATGTPLTNSLADLFVLQSYLQQNELRFREIDSFDMWINTFGERETNFEIDVDAGNLRPMTRFSSFHNLTELMAKLHTHHFSGETKADIVTQLSYALCIDTDACQHRQKTYDEIMEIFNKYVYGMEALKERIAEYILAMQYSGANYFCILLVGSPGVGKTSVCEAISEILDCDLAHVDCSGVDSVGLCGLVKSYGGAQPSKISNVLIGKGKADLLLRLDEIDKLVKDKNGDAFSALIKPFGQQRVFHDEYLDGDIDMSNTKIICTANDISKIPGYILNRFGDNVFYIPDYDTKDKAEIAKHYIIARKLMEYRIKEDELIFSDEAIWEIAANYCVDSGAREITAYVESMIRKAIKGWSRGTDPKPLLVDVEYVKRNLRRNDYGRPHKHIGFTC